MEIRKNKRIKSFCVLLECLGVAVLTLLVCVLLYKDVSRVETFRSEEAEISDAKGFRFQLDYVKDNGRDVSIQGRAYIEGEETDFFNCALVLKMADGENYYRIPTSIRVIRTRKRDTIILPLIMTTTVFLHGWKNPGYPPAIMRYTWNLALIRNLYYTPQIIP